MGSAARFYRLLLRAFPLAFRRRFEADMTAVFVDRHRRARTAGIGAALMFWIRVVPDVVAHGLAERREARRQSRGQRWRIAMWQSIVQDIRYAVRTFAQRPAFTAAALVTLALGIGANTAIFSVVHAVLLRELPYPAPEQLVRVYATHRVYQFDHGSVSPFDYDYWEQHATSLAALSVEQYCSHTLTGAGEPVRMQCSAVSPTFFEIMGVRPATGRPFTADETRTAAKVIVISHEMWQTKLGGRSDVLGARVDLDDQPWTVIGVMPASFRYPEKATFWKPYDLTPALRREIGSWFLGTIGRLKPGVSIAQAQAEMDRLGVELETAYPKNRKNRGFSVQGLKADRAARAASGLRLLQGVALVVLLIACVNVANLLLAQTSVRRHEFGVRAAIGGSRPRIVRQLLTESVVLAGAGAAIGLPIAFWGVRALVDLAPPFLLPEPASIGVSWPALAMTAIAAMATGLLFGLAPAMLSASPRISLLLRSGVREAAGGLTWSRRQWLRATLVATEVALAIVLLAGAGLLLHSFSRLLDQAPGFRTDRLLTAQLTLPAARYPTPEARSQFWSDLIARLQTLPGVEQAAGSNALPFTLWEWQSDFRIAGREDVQNDGAGVRTVSPTAFATLGIPVLAGRAFDARDVPGADPVVIVSDAFAREHMPGLDPIGQRLTFNARRPEWFTVVGVVGATRHRGLDEHLRPEIYRVLGQDPGPATLIVALRTAGDPVAFTPQLVDAVHAMDAALPVQEVKTMDALIAARTAERRFYMTLMTLFAVLAGALAATGIYGVMSYVVTQARREIGIRLALGARPVQVRTRVLRQGLRVVAIGAAIGLAGAWTLSGLLEKQLFQITTGDPAAYIAAALALLIVAAVACWLPATRTTRIDPAAVLRD